MSWSSHLSDKTMQTGGGMFLILRMTHGLCLGQGIMVPSIHLDKTRSKLQPPSDAYDRARVGVTGCPGPGFKKKSKSLFLTWVSWLNPKLTWADSRRNPRHEKWLGSKSKLSQVLVSSHVPFWEATWDLDLMKSRVSKRKIAKLHAKGVCVSCWCSPQVPEVRMG